MLIFMTRLFQSPVDYRYSNGSGIELYPSSNKHTTQNNLNRQHTSMWVGGKINLIYTTRQRGSKMKIVSLLLYPFLFCCCNFCFYQNNIFHACHSTCCCAERKFARTLHEFPLALHEQQNWEPILLLMDGKCVSVCLPFSNPLISKLIYNNINIQSVFCDCLFLYL